MNIKYPFIITMLLMTGCSKQDEFLDARPDITLTIPTTLADLQALLSNETLFNQGDQSMALMSSDDYYVTTNVWINSTATATERNAYIWAKDIYVNDASTEWSNLYKQIYYTNIVLEALARFTPGPQDLNQFQQLTGAAHFHRAYAYYSLLQLFAKPFDPATAPTDPGVPLRLKSNPEERLDRASVKDCYDQVLKDLETARSLLPVTSPYKTRPTSVASDALLARVYLSMGSYSKAGQAAESCLAVYSTLVDFNTLNPAAYPINATWMAEDLFHRTVVNYQIFKNTNASVDSTLYASYGNNDLRKTVFFTLTSGTYRFKGTYDFTLFYFSGLATDEIYLVRAECKARAGDVTGALQDLNTLLVKRWKTGTFIPVTAATATDALDKILLERRKELVYRGLRWSDLRRLNKEPRYAVTLKREINGITYLLQPNDPLYVLPIPISEITLSGITQNPR